jgi:hypothetical protein
MIENRRRAVMAVLIGLSGSSLPAVPTSKENFQNLLDNKLLKLGR